MKEKLDPFEQIKKLTLTNYLLVDKSFEVVKNSINSFDDFSFSNFFFSNSKPFDHLRLVNKEYKNILKAAFDGHFQVEFFKGYKVYFIPFTVEKMVLIYTEKELVFGEKKRKSDNEFNDNLPLEILLKLDNTGVVIAAEDNHLYYFNTTIVGKNVFELFSAEDKAVLEEGISALYSSHDALNIKLTANIRGQLMFFIGVLVRGRKDRIILILSDDTERINREFELSLKNKAIEYSPIGTYVIDYDDMFFLYANEAYYQITGFSSNQIVGGEISLFDEPYASMFFVNDTDGKERERYQESVRLKQRYEGEFLCKRINGEEYWNSMISIPVVDDETGKTIFVGIVKDVTEEKAANQRIIKAIINTQEQERSRFSLDLHDGLGQKLLAAKMNLLAFEELNDFSKGGKELYSRSLRLITESIFETRTISHSLMSHTLKGFGLANAVEELIFNFSSLPIQIEFENLVEGIRYSLDIEVGVFRIIQELTNNALKHANAKQITISIRETDRGKLSIEFKDDGCGFDKVITMNKKGGGIGIRNIKTRILFLGGQFNLTTDIDKGTFYQIYIPLERD